MNRNVNYWSLGGRYDFTPYDRAGFEARYKYMRAPEGEPDWMTALR